MYHTHICTHHSSRFFTPNNTVGLGLARAVLPVVTVRGASRRASRRVPAPPIEDPLHIVLHTTTTWMGVQRSQPQPPHHLHITSIREAVGHPNHHRGGGLIATIMTAPAAPPPYHHHKKGEVTARTTNLPIQGGRGGRSDHDNTRRTTIAPHHQHKGGRGGRPHHHQEAGGPQRSRLHPPHNHHRGRLEDRLHHHNPP